MRFLISFAEQALGSAITFGVNLWFIRNGDASSYGVYVFWYSLAWVLGTCQGTLTVTHLFNLPSGEDQRVQRRDAERILFTVTLILLLFAGLGMFATNVVIRSIGSSLAEWTGCLFVPAFLLFQYARAFAFSRGRTVLATVLTGSVFVSCALGLGADHLLGHTPDAARVMAIVGLAYGLCAAGVLAVLLRGMTPMVRTAELRRYARYLRGSGWMMLGAASGEVVGRLYSFFVVGKFGTEALARLSAVQVAIRPAWMLSSAWGSVGFPAVARRRDADDRRGVVMTMLQGVSMTLSGSAVWGAAVVVAWPTIAATLYHGRYADASSIACLWTANVMLGSIAAPINIGLLVLGEFRRLALLDLAGAAVCASSLLLLGHFDYPFAVVATMAGQATQIALMVAVIARRLRSAHSIAAPA